MIIEYNRIKTDIYIEEEGQGTPRAIKMQQNKACKIRVMVQQWRWLKNNMHDEIIRWCKEMLLYEQQTNS